MNHLNTNNIKSIENNLDQLLMERQNFRRIVSEVLSVWKNHERYLRKNVSERDFETLNFSELLSEILCKLHDNGHVELGTLVRDYQFLCESIVLPEELYFRRHGKYRLSTFEEANKTVYSDDIYMTRYMNGLLLSMVLWVNHCHCMMHYSSVFLPSLARGCSLLEIGPGHGMLLYLASKADHVDNITAWDVSNTSLKLAENSLKSLGVGASVKFELRNIFDDNIMKPEFENKFEGVVLSEVLEHLEDPVRAINVLYHVVKPGGIVWVNIPANSPAPDHLYLISSIEEPSKLMIDAGFELISTETFPTTGVTVEEAERKKLTSNCVLIGRKGGC